MQIIITLIAIVIIVLLAIWFSQNLHSSRRQHLVALAKREDWHYQHVGGLPRDFLFRDMWHLLPVSELRQHGRTLSGIFPSPTNSALRYPFYCCDFSLVNTQIETQSLIIIGAITQSPGKSKSPDTTKSLEKNLHLLLKAARFSDHLGHQPDLEPLKYKIPLSTSRRPALANRSIQTVPETMNTLANQGLLFEFQQNTLLLYKPNHILSDQQIKPALEQAVLLYEDFCKI